MKRWIWITVIVLLLAVPASAVLAEPIFDTVVEEGETVNNDVIVFDGDLEIAAKGVVNGDVVIFNGDAVIDGTINGDLVIFNGDLDAGSEARVQGDCVLLNGDISNQSPTSIRCTNIEGTVLPGIVKGIPPVPAIPAVPSAPAVPDVPDVPALPEAPAVPPVPPVRDIGRTSHIGNAFADFTRVLFSSLLLAGLAFVVAAAFPSNLQRVKVTMRRKPVASGAVGFLTALAVPIVLAILAVISAVLTIVCIGLLGFPIILVIVLALVAAVTMGWIGAGSWLGERLIVRKGTSLPVKAALGTFLLTFVIGLLGILTGGWLEALLGILITSVGLGAVALTQFGRRAYEAPRIEEDPDKISVVLDTLPDDNA